MVMKLKASFPGGKLMGKKNVSGNLKLKYMTKKKKVRKSFQTLPWKRKRLCGSGPPKVFVSFKDSEPIL